MWWSSSLLPPRAWHSSAAMAAAQFGRLPSRVSSKHCCLTTSRTSLPVSGRIASSKCYLIYLVCKASISVNVSVNLSWYLCLSLVYVILHCASLTPLPFSHLLSLFSSSLSPSLPSSLPPSGVLGTPACTVAAVCLSLEWHSWLLHLQNSDLLVRVWGCEEDKVY